MDILLKLLRAKRKGRGGKEERWRFLVQKGEGEGDEDDGSVGVLFFVTDGILGSFEGRVFFCLAKSDGSDLNGLSDGDLDGLQVHRLVGRGAIVDWGRKRG